MTRIPAAALLLSLTTAAPGLTPAAAGDYAGHDGRVSATCRSTAILGHITSAFGRRATHYLRSDIAIGEIRDMRQGRFVPRDATHSVEREYCRATAITTDGEKRALWYLIERDFGFAGIGASVEFCVSGLDPWYVYGAQCASLR